MTGQVLDVHGNPVADAQVVAISASDIQGGSGPQVGGQAYTNGNGNYTITGITVGPVTVKAGIGISVGSSAGNIERAGTTAVVNVTLNSGAVNVSGVVTQVQNGVTTPIPGLLPVAYYLVCNGLQPDCCGLCPEWRGWQLPSYCHARRRATPLKRLSE